MRRQAQREWFAIALTPTWLGRLAIALALAAAFALLGQWQLSRALPAPSSSPAVGSKPAQVYETFIVTPDAGNFALINGRLQADGASGVWLVTNSQVVSGPLDSQVGHDLTVAWGWAPTADEALAAQKLLNRQTFAPQHIELRGILADSEAPIQARAGDYASFDSLSLAQLVNVYRPVQERQTVQQFLILQSQPELFAASGLQPILVSNKPATKLESVNWLSAFYALEWSVFAGFAVFMWWRLVEDERLRRRAES